MTDSNRRTPPDTDTRDYAASKDNATPEDKDKHCTTSDKPKMVQKSIIDFLLSKSGTEDKSSPPKKQGSTIPTCDQENVQGTPGNPQAGKEGATGAPDLLPSGDSKVL